jgi:hypothetical protein
MIKNRMNRHTNSPQMPGGGGAQVQSRPRTSMGLRARPHTGTLPAPATWAALAPPCAATQQAY